MEYSLGRNARARCIVKSSQGASQLCLSINTYNENSLFLAIVNLANIKLCNTALQDGAANDQNCR